MASVLVEGARAVELVSQLLHTPVGQRPIDRIVVAHWGGATGEEVVVARRGDEQVEVHCHGGTAAAGRIIDDLARAGCEVMSWQEFVADAALDPIAAAAQIALAEAPTQRTAAILLDQYAGALRRAIDEIKAAIHAGNRRHAETMLGELLDREALGRHLTRPWRVSLAGPPNVGKSSLINALVGYPRAIVHATPGTTRDVVTATTALAGWPVELADTAGLRTSDDTIETAGVELARRQLAQADCVLLVFDVTQPWGEAGERLIAERPDAVVVHNKLDLASASNRPHGIETSAVTGQGLAILQQQIVERLVPDLPPPGAAVPFTEGQIASLTAALQSLRRGDLPAAAGRFVRFGEQARDC